MGIVNVGVEVSFVQANEVASSVSVLDAFIKPIAVVGNEETEHVVVIRSVEIGNGTRQVGKTVLHEVESF